MNLMRSGAVIAAGVAVFGILTGGNASAAPAKSANALCGSPTIVAEPGVTTFGTDGDDVILGSWADDEIFAYGGNDVICGEGGNDDIYGMDGIDRIDGGEGDDFIDLVDRLNDSAVDCGGGYDTVITDWEPFDRNLRNCEEVA